MTASVARFIESFIPENYNLFLDINRSEKTFTGNVAITGEALDNHISLHQKDLTISSVVKRRKLFQHSLNLISLVKLFLVLMNQKQKQLLIFH